MLKSTAVGQDLSFSNALSCSNHYFLERFRMKIGVLTLPLVLNYGGILQCWALQKFLMNSGFDVQVIDYRFENYTLKSQFAGILRREKAKLFLKMLLFPEVRAAEKRIEKTAKFIREQIRYSSFNFTQWKQVPEDALNYDVVVTGSDQVWNSEFGAHIFLLENMTKTVKFIAFSASFGMIQIPPDWIERYRTGIAKYDSVSVRERHGLELVSQVGGSAEWTCDPTLLVPVKDWENLCGEKCREENVLLCYFMRKEYLKYIPDFKKIAEKKHCRIKILVGEPSPHLFASLLHDLKTRWLCRCAHIAFGYSHGPSDFVAEFAKAKYVLSDSFHALMFSVIFKKNVRILRPHDANMRNMFSRIADFLPFVQDGQLIAEDIRSGLNSFCQDEPLHFHDGKLQEFIEKSRNSLLNRI